MRTLFHLLLLQSLCALTALAHIPDFLHIIGGLIPGVGATYSFVNGQVYNHNNAQIIGNFSAGAAGGMILRFGKNLEIL